MGKRGDRKSRHIPEKTAVGFVDNRKNIEIMESDVQRALKFLRSPGVRTVTGEEMREWYSWQEPKWTPGYIAAIKSRVATLIASTHEQDAATARARLLNSVDGLLPRVQEPKIWSGYNPTDPAVKDPQTPQFKAWRKLAAKKTTWENYCRSRDACRAALMPDPAPPFAEPWSEHDDAELAAAEEECPLLITINHPAALGYLKFVAELTGSLKLPEQRAGAHNDLDALSNDELRALVAMAKAKTIDAETIE